MWLTGVDICKREFCSFYQKLFKENRLFVNTTLSEKTDFTFDLVAHNIRTTENFNYAGEEYPVIIVGAQAGKLTITDLQDFGEVASHEADFGVTATGWDTIGIDPFGVQRELAVKFIPEFNFNLEQVSFYLKNNPVYSQGDITVSLYRGGADPSAGTFVDSGSIRGFNNVAMHYEPAGFSDKIPVNKDQAYWIVLSTDSESSYNVFSDNEVASGSYAVKPADTGIWTVIAGGSLVGKLRGNSSNVMSGDITFPINVQIAAKDASTADKIFDICLLFTELAKMLPYKGFVNNNIRLSQVTFEGDTAPIAFQDEKIFKRTLTISVVSAWTYDISQELLSALDFDISTY